jgi:hypothetical protein
VEAPKDERLAGLSARFNVAQFVSFSAGQVPQARYSRIRGRVPDEKFRDVRTAIAALMQATAGSANVRSFRLGRDKGNPFHYGLTTIDQVVSTVTSLSTEGYSTIVNETIDTDDGGVSGVALGGVVEFTPFDTPRGVEKPGAVSMPYELALGLLKTVYGFHPDVPPPEGERMEFSIHPARLGYRHTHTLLWETERAEGVRLGPLVQWPNRFSRLIGDKVFGLLIAHLLDLPVPAATVVSRGVAPFRFGLPTGTSEFWIRTSPAEQQPGKFTTTYGWQDPYILMAREDPDGTAIASVISQESVEPVYSGASLPGPDEDSDYVEGVKGRGDDFMLGQQRPDPLPSEVVHDVRMLAKRARSALGPVRIEFVHDGKKAWVVQLHRSAARYRSGVISPGRPRRGWLDFNPAAGLEILTELITRAQAEDKGVRVVGPVGLTSHVGDLLRKAGVPAELFIPDQDQEY